MTNAFMMSIMIMIGGGGSSSHYTFVYIFAVFE